ncbi:MAG: aminoacyl-tRNA hydrolase [Sumerlaeia bacterium]
MKQIIVMRTDLNMRKGKMIAQGAHAAMAFLAHRVRSSAPLTDEQRAWIDGAFTKVCVRVESEEALQAIHARALEHGLESHLIVDSGKTEFKGLPTATCCAIGPDRPERLEEVTGALKLL